MKFIHLADCHLSDSFDFGASLSDTIRKASNKSFDYILKANKDVDFALIAGDLYERDYFTLSDYKELFNKISDFKKDVFYLAGNHDYIDDTNRPVFKNKPDNLHVFGTDSLEFFELGNVRVYGISYADRIFNRNFDYNISLDKSYFNILLGHGDVGVEGSPYLNFDLDRLRSLGFSYVGLGHIHKWEDFGDNIYYAGAIEPHDFTDTYDYGYILYDEAKAQHINSSRLKFYDLDLSNLGSKDELINKLSEILEDKENLLRLKTNIAISEKSLKKSLDLGYLDLKHKEDKSVEDLVGLYPNSLLERYMAKFDGNLTDKEKLALSLGLDAIFRSQDD